MGEQPPRALTAASGEPPAAPNGLPGLEGRRRHRGGEGGGDNEFERRRGCPVTLERGRMWKNISALKGIIKSPKISDFQRKLFLHCFTEPVT
ncbi:transmembrane protein 60 isoform X2 [Colius striatus]|uniref:transmembrane protein 60 isoform X2 n=1 Tax=Colius striatus TaxID=57412 RepID=UPI002B1E53C2|nr:transmembrane protein 60 isoform X2 [Colius striatus]